MTEKDKNMFESLQGTALGSQLLDYVRRVQGESCDSRKWKEGEDRTHANKVNDVLEEYFVSRLIVRSGGNTPGIYPYV